MGKGRGNGRGMVYCGSAPFVRHEPDELIALFTKGQQQNRYTRRAAERAERRKVKRERRA